MANLHRHACLVDSLESSAEKFRRYIIEAAVGDRVTIVLRPFVLLPDLGAEVMLRRDVIVTMATGPSYTVSWMPSDEGPFPRLIGELRIVADTPFSSRLILIGDMVASSPIGHRFNQAIAKELLAHLSQHIV